MLLYNKTIKVQVAKYVKTSTHGIHQKHVRFSYPEQYFLHQRAAYVFYMTHQNGSISTAKDALLLQKKENSIIYIKFRMAALRALLLLSSFPDEYYKMRHRFSLSSLDNLLDLSKEPSLLFLGADKELYIVHKSHNHFKIVRISDTTSVYELPDFKMIGVALPLYNNFIPIVVKMENSFTVIVYDIINRTKYEVARYSIDFLESQIVDYISKLTGSDISSNIRFYREFYKIQEPYRFTGNETKKSFEICSNLSVCQSVLYITNSAISESNENNIVFEMKFKIRDEKLYYEISIPSGIHFRIRGVREKATKHVIETQTISISPPKTNYVAPNIFYRQNNCLLIRDFVYKDSCYIIDLEKNIKRKIPNNLSYRNGTQFFMIQNFIMSVYFASTKLSQERPAWHLMIYDTTEGRFFNTLVDDWREGATANLLSYYYIENCQKVVFILGQANDKSRDFYNIYESRLLHTISAITILDLAKLSDIDNNGSIEDCKEMIKMPFFMEKYLKDRWGIDTFYVQTDCTVDAGSSMLYVTAYIFDYKNPVITMAKNICRTNDNLRNFSLEVPVLRTYDLTEDRTKPIYISIKALRRARFPKYLHMYDLKGFYDFMNSKTVNTGLVFVSYPNFSIIDRYYKRTSQFYEEFSELYLTYPVLIDNYLVGYYMSENVQPHSLAGIFVINDLSIVRSL